MQPSDTPKKQKGRRKRANAGKRVRAAIDRIGDAYFALCLDTRKLYDVNPAAEALFSSNSDQLLKSELRDLVHPDSLADYDSLEARLDAGEEGIATELFLNRPGGEALGVELNVANHTIAGKRLAIFIARERMRDAERSRGPQRAVYSTRTTSPDGMRPTRDSSARST